jgi:hypothetical protein
MLIVNEYPERYGWWMNELKYKENNELNDLKEIRNPTENIKEAFYHNYKAE